MTSSSRAILLALFGTLAVVVRPVGAGCYQKRLCCSGRNNSCVAVDDGIAHLPTAAPPPAQRRPHYLHEYHTPYYDGSEEPALIFPDVYNENDHEKIGKLVFPDVVELEGSGGADLYDKYGPNDNPEGPAQLVQLKPLSIFDKVTHFIFGDQKPPEEPPEDILRYSKTRPRHLLIRYSVLQQHIPVIIHSAKTVQDHDYNIQYLEAAATECYCDEDCVALGDCCSDYTFVCPPRDCVLSSWSHWSACRADNGHCGTGEQERRRKVLSEPEHGGAACEPLVEMRTCHALCPSDDITTVALLLDYKYNLTRARSPRDRIFWDPIQRRTKTGSYYCVQYELGWVNRNCIQKEYNQYLFRGNTICAECQPQAQFHRRNGRCASDLEDGDEGFWKLIGPKSCYGIWRRLERRDNCRCAANITSLPPFLMV